MERTTYKTKKIFPNWNSVPGDIDIIAGNMKNESIDLDNILAIQVKIRRINSKDDVKKFASGAGIEQSVITSTLGFDRTILLHILVKDPKEYTIYVHPNAAWFQNSDFTNYEKVNEEIAIEYFKNNKRTFGYGWLSWIQVYDRNFWESGGFSTKILYEPPYHKGVDNRNKQKIVDYLTKILNNNQSKHLPIIIHSKV